MPQIEYRHSGSMRPSAFDFGIEVLLPGLTHNALLFVQAERQRRPDTCAARQLDSRITLLVLQSEHDTILECNSETDFCVPLALPPC